MHCTPTLREFEEGVGLIKNKEKMEGEVGFRLGLVERSFWEIASV